MADTLTEKRGVIADAGTSKAKIERAALILFVDKSIEGVSTKSIAAFADVSEGLLYRHYKSKSDLSRALMKTIHERLTRLVRSHMDQTLDAAVSDIVRDYATLADEDWPLFAYHLLAPDLLASMALGVVMQAAHSKLLGANIGALSDHVDMFERAVMAVLEDA